MMIIVCAHCKNQSEKKKKGLPGLEVAYVILIFSAAIAIMLNARREIQNLKVEDKDKHP